MGRRRRFAAQRGRRQAKAGERIVAVNGQPVRASGRRRRCSSTRRNESRADAAPPARGTRRTAIARRRRTVVVTTLADEVPARYREWVERNRAWVHEKSNGRVGYLHLPDMMSAGFAEFHRYFGTECDRDALIVDVRYNRGGHVSQLLLEKVARRRHRLRPRALGTAGAVPGSNRRPGPVVALTNEHAGSDGDIFSHSFKLMRIGPLVGTRTWGGVIGICPRHKLVDGSETTQPEFSFWFNDVGFARRELRHRSGDRGRQRAAGRDDGRDRQLETALATALELADKATPSKPEFGERPVLRRSALPPRKAARG